ncbi:glycosyl hydrolase catalytic core-domain-containing protein [Mycena belliarum]|uniref:Glycosyl hydrolase catalytic core-domain-containing protein n=1 Tax=Mycena belliarum TaxID=1033014 RepID=A0AAD6XXG5_9AGAR|nr:glycosyl hydrolase catalytic core-domain-containing protein [Mycena belliae]
MAPPRFLAILSLTLLALLACSFVAPTNAVSLQSSSHIVRNTHGELARRKSKKRSNSKRCKALSSSLSAPTTSKKATVAATKAKEAAFAPTTSTKAAAPTKAPNSGSNSGSNSGGGGGGGGGDINLPGKACLAWPNGGANKLSSWKGSKTGLIYTWDANKPPDADRLGFTFAPMLWGWKDTANFQAKTVEGYAKIALGPNECNEVGQSNMDPHSAIQLWRQYMMPLAKKGYTLISPAMSSRPNGKDWMKTFMSQCGDDCAISGIATHYYGVNIEEFKAYVTYWHDTYHLPVYVTEYADQNFDGGPQASMNEIWAFMTAATQWMDQQSWVKAHCWFGAMQGMDNVNPLNKLMNDAGTGPNDLGNYFINN